MDKIELLSLDLDGLAALMQDLGEPAFRAKQIAQWLPAGAKIAEMTNVSKQLRRKLSEIAVANPVEIEKTLLSENDGTEKYLYRLADQNIVEGVLMRNRYGDTLCLSTQVGCRMGCRFCASTLEGCARNLTSGEMLGQVACVNRKIRPDGRKVHNIVLMGSGEPFDNYENVVRFLRLLNSADGFNMSLRNVSLSTCGIVAKMYAFAQEGLPVTLSLSLHAPTDEIRRKIMPVANAYPLEQVMAALKNYVDKTGRRAVIEYAMIRGINDAPKCAEALSKLLRGLRCHVNLIPLNGVKERDLLPSDRRTVDSFAKLLTNRHVSVTVRREMGADIEGACGQLRRKFLQQP